MLTNHFNTCIYAFFKVLVCSVEKFRISINVSKLSYNALFQMIGISDFCFINFLFKHAPKEKV